MSRSAAEQSPEKVAAEVEGARLDKFLEQGLRICSRHRALGIHTPKQAAKHAALMAALQVKC